MTTWCVEIWEKNQRMTVMLDAAMMKSWDRRVGNMAFPRGILSRATAFCD